MPKKGVGKLGVSVASATLKKGVTKAEVLKPLESQIDDALKGFCDAPDRLYEFFEKKVSQFLDQWAKFRSGKMRASFHTAGANTLYTEISAVVTAATTHLKDVWLLKAFILKLQVHKRYRAGQETLMMTPRGGSGLVPMRIAELAGIDLANVYGLYLKLKASASAREDVLDAGWQGALDIALGCALNTTDLGKLVADDRLPTEVVSELQGRYEAREKAAAAAAEKKAFEKAMTPKERLAHRRRVRTAASDGAAAAAPAPAPAPAPSPLVALSVVTGGAGVAAPPARKKKSGRRRHRGHRK